MSSILTNNGAMVALQTLKSINNDLSKTQNQISTGLEISSAADNASLWAISQVMEADVAGFEAVSSSLSLGESTVAVGRAAAESVNELLVDIKEQIVLAQAPGADTDAIQTEIASLRDQVTSIVGAAQFNGQNLLSNTSTTAGEGTVEVLASLNRDENGAVTTTDINVQKQDLSQTDSAAGATATTDYTVTAAGTPAANGGTGTYTLGFNTGVTEVAAQA
ncbi:MAG: flagellin, partial [Pseudomonadota bacterium]